MNIQDIQSPLFIDGRPLDTGREFVLLGEVGRVLGGALRGGKQAYCYENGNESRSHGDAAW
jgi:hypothetical protein